MNWYLIVTLIIVGCGMIFLELFLLPGFIVGIIGALITIFAIVQAYVNYGVMVGNLILLATIIGFVVILILFFRPKTWKKISLQETIDKKVNTIDASVQVGVRGITVSRLAPMGKAFINNAYYEVSTYGEYIEANEEIEVFKIEGNKIYVRKPIKT